MHYTMSRTWCNRKTAILQAMLLPWYCQNYVSMYFQQLPVSEIYLILSYLSWHCSSPIDISTHDNTSTYLKFEFLIKKKSPKDNDFKLLKSKPAFFLSFFYGNGGYDILQKRLKEEGVLNVVVKWMLNFFPMASWCPEEVWTGSGEFTLGS